MEINKKLNLDVDIEFLESGSLCQASNIVVNNTNGGVLNENAILPYYEVSSGETIVGQIACSNEFIVFTSSNKIFRIKDKTKEVIQINTNWKWEGGKVIGTYTYNVNDECIIAISEINNPDDKDVSLKIINLDKPDYVDGQSDDKYTLSPEIPQVNINNYKYISGNSIYKGTYIFFIRFKKGNEFTGWTKIGYPILTYNETTEILEDFYALVSDNTGKQVDKQFTVEDVVNDNAERVYKNILLNISLKDRTLEYEYFQIGYIVNTTKFETKVFSTALYTIDTRTIVIDNYNNDRYEFSVDDMTDSRFNIYNVNTLCNYNNRLYIANYKEENPNITIPNIDVSSIKVKAFDYNQTVYPTTEVRTKLSTRSTRSTRNITDPRSYYLDLAGNPSTHFIYGAQYCFRVTYKNQVIQLYGKDIAHFNISSLASVPTTERTSYNTNAVIIPIYDFLCAITTRSKGANTFEYITDNKYMDRMYICFYYSKIGPNCIQVGFGISKGSTDDNRIPHVYKRGAITNIIYNLSNTFYPNIKSTDIVVNYCKRVDVVDNVTSIFKEPAWDLGFVLAVGGNKQISSIKCYKQSDIARQRGTKITRYGKLVTNTSGNYYDVLEGYTNIFIDKKTFKERLDALYPDRIITSVNYKMYVKDEGGTASEQELRVDYPDKVRLALHHGAQEPINLIYDYDKYNQGAEYFWRVADKFSVTFADGETINHDINLLSGISEIVCPNGIGNIDSMEQYYKPKRQWTVDREPTDDDFNPNNTYRLNIRNQYKNSTAELVVNTKPVPIGLFNRTTINDDTIRADKDFALVIKFEDWAITNSGTAPIAKNQLTDVVFNRTGNSNDIVFDCETLENVYVAFYKRGINGTYYQGVVFSSTTPDDFSDVRIIYDLKNFTANDIFYVKINDIPATVGVPSTTGYLNYIIRPTNFCVRTDEVIGGDEDVSVTTYDAELKKYAINTAVYNFFIHYVYPNGLYTNGIRIPNTTEIPLTTINLARDNTQTYTYTVKLTDKISDVRKAYEDLKLGNDVNPVHEVHRLFGKEDELYFYNVYPRFNKTTNVGIYINTDGEILFRGRAKDYDEYYTYSDGYHSYEADTFPEPIKFIFEGVKMYPEFVGFFISYEKSEPIMISPGIVTKNTESIISQQTGGSSVGQHSNINFFFPNFNITRGQVTGNIYVEAGTRKFNGYTGQFSNELKYPSIFRQMSTAVVNREPKLHLSHVDTNKILSYNNADNRNGNVEGILNLILSNDVVVARSYSEPDIGILYNIRNSIYLNDNKDLISLGFVKFVDYSPTNPDKTYDYGYEPYPFNWDYYMNQDPLFSFNKAGVVYDEVNPVPINSSGVRLFDKVLQRGTKSIPDIVTTYFMPNFSIYPTITKHIKEEPIKKYYTFATENNDFTASRLTIHLYPDMINNLYEINASYYDYIDKVIVNFNRELYNNFITDYKNTIRRSDVISDESVENKWRVFRSDNYRLIAENKGDIINVVGIGGYLIAHCEHSMFIFNRDSSMKTEDKNVQLVIPDTFDIDYVEMFTSTKGYAGIQKFNQFVCSNYGYIFYDSDAHKIYRFDEKELLELTPGFKNLFMHEVQDIRFVIDETNERLICIGSISIDNVIKKFAISFSFNLNNWVSTHSYWYEDCFNTKNGVYFVINNRVSSIDKTKFNTYDNVILDADNIFKTEIEEITTIEENGITPSYELKTPYSYVDVVFNNNNIDTVLNYITYIINKSTDERYSGHKLLIYTNCCYTDYVDIHTVKESMKDYKHPYYRYGIWTMNWFRNKVDSIKTLNPIIRGNGKFDDNVELIVRRGLDNALVVGKWFVVRLIFMDEDKRISVNDIQCY